MKSLSKFSKWIISIAIIGFIFGSLSYCKKEGGNLPNILSNGSFVGADFTNARLINTYSGITYNAELNILSFTSREVFEATETKLRQEINQYQKDDGQTLELLEMITTGTPEERLCDSLISNSPLSDTVMLEFMNHSVLPENFKNVMLANLDISGPVALAYNAVNITEDLRTEIDNAIQNHSPFVPGLSEFEKIFSGYISHRKIICDGEHQFLMNGGDPFSQDNPREKSTLGLISATLFNKDLEVMIAGQIVKLLPNKKKNVLIKNASTAILTYIRLHGDIPMYTPPTNEPENGFPIAQAQPIVDPAIEVQPTDIYNSNCGGSEVTASPGDQNRIRYTPLTSSDDLKYYWDFGDGFVSYKKNPEHRFVGENVVFQPTLTVYNSMGAPCGGPYTPPGGSSGSGGGGSSGGASCGSANVLATPMPGFNADIGVWCSFTGYVPGTPIAYLINFGDGSSASGTFNNTGWNNIAHQYPIGQYTNYNISISLTYNTTSCNIPLTSIIRFLAPAPVPVPGCNCDKRDREKAVEKTPDNDHKFKHKLKLTNIISLGGKFTADMNTYERYTFLALSIWKPDWTSGCIDLIGGYYSPCTNTSNNCSAVTPISLQQGPNCGGSPNHGVSWNNGNCYYYINPNQISSTATAYGVYSTIFIGCSD